jgi:hypothetical protein
MRYERTVIIANSPAAKGAPILACALLLGCAESGPKSLVTIADARVDKARFVDVGSPGDSPGDMYVFDQPLLDQDGENIGNNSGVCIRTRVGHSLQCQWTLTLDDGTIQVAGREFDTGTSSITIVGGTGAYAGINGQMESTNNQDGTFSQVLHYRLP